MGRCVIEKACVLCKPFYISFIPCVDKDWRIVLGPSPICIIDQIPLLESMVALGIVVEMVKYLGEVFGSVKFVWCRNRHLFW